MMRRPINRIFRYNMERTMSTISGSTHTRPSPFRGRTGAFTDLSDSLRRAFKVWAQRHRTRQDLADLPPELLKDIGLTPEQVSHELRKPFWRE
jgi:uncharacterized protein YjiS (DUF1127 family)